MEEVNKSAEANTTDKKLNISDVVQQVCLLCNTKLCVDLYGTMNCCKGCRNLKQTSV